MTTLCPEPGRLRAWLDREAASTEPSRLADEAVGEHLAAHLSNCEACQDALVQVRDDSAVTAAALEELAGPPPSAAETELALRRLRSQLASDALSEPTPINARAGQPLAAASGAAAVAAPDRPGTDGQAPPAPLRRPQPPISTLWRRWRLALAGLAAAVALTVAVATPEGQAAAAGFLAQFRSQRLAVVSFNSLESRQSGLARIEQLGTLQNQRQPRPAEVANVQEAASKAGFPVLQPDPATLPAGVARTPKVRYAPATETRLTFDRQKARAYFDDLNRKDLALPDRLHNATLVVTLPPMVMLEYAGSDNRPGLMIGQAREVQVNVEGRASLEEVRTFLLNLPGLPPDLVRQLSAIQDWTTTLPIPVPVDKISWQETAIAGAPAFILNDNTGLGSGVIWQRDGRILGVAGPLKATDIRRVAENLR